MPGGEERRAWREISSKPRYEGEQEARSTSSRGGARQHASKHPSMPPPDEEQEHASILGMPADEEQDS